MRQSRAFLRRGSCHGDRHHTWEEGNVIIYFTADTHFYHSNVIQYEQRPFQTAEEMNEALIRNWNAKVSPDDDIFILGDFTLKGPSQANALLERLQGRKYLIRGNHDGFADRASFRQDAFVWVRDYFELCWHDQYFVLCHYPLLSWNGMHRGAFHLHGHQHNKRHYNEGNRDDGLRRLDVGVDANGMAPISAEEPLLGQRSVVDFAGLDETDVKSGLE